MEIRLLLRSSKKTRETRELVNQRTRKKWIGMSFTFLREIIASVIQRKI